MPADQELNADQIQSFIENGYVVVPDCFSAETAKHWTDRAYVRLGYDPDDSSTWVQEKIHMPSVTRFPVQEFAPRAYRAMCQLLGGEERILQPVTWGDSFILNLGWGRDRPWTPPSPAAGGWHKDGDFFRHFLDSPEQGLLTIVLWSDVVHQGGATYAAPDSVGPIARFLAGRPDGVLPGEFNFPSLIRECSQFVELTGRVGDVVLLHPFMLHASSQNPLRIPRFITNPPVALKEPMNFNREDPADFSPVEQAVLHGLGVERYAFHPTVERERVVPERVRRQQKMLEEEKARLPSSGLHPNRKLSQSASD